MCIQASKQAYISDDDSNNDDDDDDRDDVVIVSSFQCSPDDMCRAVYDGGSS